MGNVALQAPRNSATMTAPVSRVRPHPRVSSLARFRAPILLVLLSSAVFLPLLGRAPISDHEARVMFTALTMADAGWPWRASGEWWDVEAWAREEWDVVLSDGALCRIARDRLTGHWYLDALYD